MHYTVTVITKDGDYDSALAPFSEWKEVVPYIIRTREEVIKQKRDNLEYLEEHDPKFAKDLKKHYDFSSDEALITSIIKKDTDKFTKFNENGDELSTYNPSGKYDWYELGGRWDGMLIRKKSGRKVNKAKVKDIDFDAYKLSPERLEEEKRRWDIVVNDAPLKEGEEDPRDLFDSRQAYLMDYGDIETYLKVMGSFFTNSLLYRGEWYQADPTSCICNDTERNVAYINKFFEIISKLDPQDHIAVIDCHQ